jgi:hypothetical protein
LLPVNTAYDDYLFDRLLGPEPDELIVIVERLGDSEGRVH